MLQISAQQLAELLMGIARSQAAIISGLESAIAGAKNTHVAPMLQNVAHLRDHPQPTLTDLPVRILLASMGRIGPEAAGIAKDLERLCSAGASGSAPSGKLPASGENLDFSKPG